MSLVDVATRHPPHPPVLPVLVVAPISGLGRLALGLGRLAFRFHLRLHVGRGLDALILLLLNFGVLRRGLLAGGCDPVVPVHLKIIAALFAAALLDLEHGRAGPATDVNEHRPAYIGAQKSTNLNRFGPSALAGIEVLDSYARS